MPDASATGCQQNATGLPDLQAYVSKAAAVLECRCVYTHKCVYVCLCLCVDSRA